MSYAWAGAGVNTKAAGTADVVIAFDLERHVPKDNARGTGVNVLFVDGSVTFVGEAAAKAVWSQFVAGVRPIRLPAPAVGAASQPSLP